MELNSWKRLVAFLAAAVFFFAFLSAWLEFENRVASGAGTIYAPSTQERLVEIKSSVRSVPDIEKRVLALEGGASIKNLVKEFQERLPGDEEAAANLRRALKEVGEYAFDEFSSLPTYEPTIDRLRVWLEPLECIVGHDFLDDAWGRLSVKRVFAGIQKNRALRDWRWKTGEPDGELETYVLEEQENFIVYILGRGAELDLWKQAAANEVDPCATDDTESETE